MDGEGDGRVVPRAGNERGRRSRGDVTDGKGWSDQLGQNHNEAN